jgi:hypothetical protein
MGLIASIDNTYWNLIRRILIINRLCLGGLCQPAGKAVDLKIIRMAGTMILAAIGLVVLVPQRSFAQG